MDNDEKVIYVITRGEYSDYYVCGATTDRKRAEYLQKLYTDGLYHAEIEEYVDGDPEAGPCKDLKPIWCVNLTDGGMWYAWVVSYSIVPFTNSYEFVNDIGTMFVATVMAEDEEHAIKIAQDQMAKMLAEKEGL